MKRRRPDPSSETYTVYERTVRGKFALAVVHDCGYERGERRGRTTCVRVTARYQADPPDGMPSAQAWDRLQHLDDTLMHGCEEAGALCAATLTTNGTRTWIIYCASGAKTAERLRDAARRAKHPVTLRLRKDAPWSAFARALPTDAEVRWNADMSVIRELKSAGDQIHVPRPIEHVMLVNKRSAVASLTAWLPKAGFTEITVTREPRGGRRWCVECQQASSLYIDDVFAQTSLLSETVAGLRGEYDGWSTRLVRTSRTTTSRRRRK